MSDNALPPPRPFFVGDEDTYTTDTDSDREPPTSATPFRTQHAVPQNVAAAWPPRGRPMPQRRGSTGSQTASNTRAVNDQAQSPGESGAWSPSALYQDDTMATSPHSQILTVPATLNAPQGTQQQQQPSASPTSSRAERPVSPGTLRGRPPPSAYPFPFQAYVGNPDPGMAIPGIPRRYSLEMNRDAGNRTSLDSDSWSNYAPAVTYNELGRPHAPFMAEGGNSPASGSGSANNSTTNLNASVAGSSSNSVYRQSAAAGLSASPPSPHQTYPPSQGGNGGGIPRTSSTHSFRAPFLSPASRPSSSLWSPPSYPQLPTFPQVPGGTPPSNGSDGIDGGSTPNLAQLGYPYPPARAPKKKVLPSTRLAAKLTKDDKPWMRQRDVRGSLSWWSTLFLILLGIIGAALICFIGISSVNTLSDSQLCLVMDDSFGGGISDDNWIHENTASGLGVNAFSMSSDSDKNSFVRNGQLYLYPTLTSESDLGLSDNDVLNGANFTVPNCSEGSTQVEQKNGNRTTTVTIAGEGCAVSSNQALGKVINPVLSARLSTRGKKSLKYGKVEVRAKLPKGNWLWPSISLYPEQPTYGDGPLSGRIDLLSSRGNTPTQKEKVPLGFTSATSQSGLFFGPFKATRDSAGQTFTGSNLTPSFLAPLSARIFGYVTNKREPLDASFHTYGMEWTPQWVRFYLDGKVRRVLEVQIENGGKLGGVGGPKGKSIFDRGDFPKTARNGSAEVVVQNPWDGAAASAPFDQPFHLVIDLSAGGTSGWFPDNLGGKPWYDGSETAMRDFFNAKDQWYQTWPLNEDERSFRIDSVKMWKICNID
ncbi:concanavalin A-like lectin/glucanase [Pleurotus eryngii]|uniref:Concanavalin A-like lectin/glucanase n=1 Tax=Pleurotus eryngii TaxID=5323 RepID=A0A9P6DEU6_PLEER|nr:concanavalin A-like lectin/glucanase [Pleurotus eryngii]